MASSLLIRLGLDLSALTRQLNDAESRLKRFGFKAERLGRDLTTRVSLPIIGIGVAAVKTFADFDKLEKGLSAVAGSAKEGSRQFGSLLDIVKDTQTTLDLKSAAGASLQLQAVGQSAKGAERLLRQLGIAATLTGNTAGDVGEVGRQFAQAAAKGKILQQELRIVLERLPGLARVISDEFGTITAEGLNKAGVSADQFLSRLTTAAEKSEVFKNVQGGLAKAIETFGIELQIAGKELGETIAKTFNLEQNLARLSTFISNAVNRFKELSPAMQKVILYSAALAAATGPLLFGLGAMARTVPLLASGFGLLLGPLGKVGKVAGFVFSAFAQLGSGSIIQRILGFVGVFAKQLSKLKFVFVALTSPIGLTVAAIALLAIGFATAYKKSRFFRAQIKRVGEVFKPVVDVIKNLAGGILTALGISLVSVGGVFQGVFGFIGASISASIELFLQFANTVKLVAGALSDLANLDFGAAADKLNQSLLSPAGLIKSAKAVGNAFTTTLGETLEDTPIHVPSFAVPGDGGDGDDAKPSGSAKLASAIDEIDFGIVDGLNTTSLALQQVARDSKFVQSRIDELKPSLQGDFFANYRDGLDVIAEKQIAFGDTYDALGAKIGLTRSAITALLDDGYTAQSGAVELLVGQLDEQIQKQEALVESTTKMAEAMALMGQVSNSAFGKVATAMSKGETAVKAFGKAVVSSLREAIAAHIQEGVAASVAGALKTVVFPFNIGLAAAAGAGASALFNSVLSALNVPFLANGGITTGAGLFVAGEAGPEAIIPLNRLHEFTDSSGTNVHVTGEFELLADRLIALIRQAEPGFERAY